jgi:hypothetical protein
MSERAEGRGKRRRKEEGEEKDGDVKEVKRLKLSVFL